MTPTLDGKKKNSSHNAKISISHDFRAVPAFCDVSTWSERPLDFAGNLNRAIFVRSGWFLHRWKALFKVDWECHTFRPLERTFQHRKSSLKFKFSLVNVTIDPFLEREKNGNFACKFQIFESEKNFLAVSGSNCQVLPHQNPTEPWISWRIPWRRKNHLSSLKFKFLSIWVISSKSKSNSTSFLPR